MAIKTIRVFQEFTSAGYVPMPVAGNIDYGVTIANTFPATTPTTFQTDDPDIDVTLTATTDYYVWIRSHGTDWNPMYTRNVRVYPDSPLINNVVMGIIIANLSGTVPYTGATTNVDLGTYGLKSDYLQLNTSPTSIPTTVGTMSWNDSDGTANLKLKGGNVTLQIGQEEVVRVVNKSGATLNEADFRAVRMRSVSEGGAQGQRLAVVLAQADSDANSDVTLGLVTETISNNQEGFITISGNVSEINTTGAKSYGGSETWVDGDILYLSPTHAGYLTNVKPTAPNHSVIVGFVVYSHAIHGKIFVKVDNGYLLNDLHNVQITSVANKNTLVYDSATQLWKNRNIFGTQGYLPYYDNTLLMKDSVIFTNGTNVGISSTSLTEKLVVGGNILATSFKKVGGLSTEFLKADGSSDATAYQPLSADLTAIDNLALTTGLLRKNGLNTWELDQTEYLSVAIAGSTYQTLANLSSNLTASTTKYPSVNAVNTGLALKLNLTGGTLTGGLTLNYSYPNIALSDVSSGTTWNIQNDGSTFKLNYGSTNNFYIFSNGNAAFVNNLTASALIKSGGTSTQFLKADGSVDNTNYQPYDADLASIAGLELTTGLLRKNGLNTYTLDQTEYVALSTANSTYQTLANLQSNLNASSTKYPSVNAVNTGLNLKLNLAGGVLTGDLALAYSYPNIQLSDTSSGTIWNIQNDGGGFEINSGITNKFVMYSSGNATFVNDLTANKFIKSGGTSSQFLMADGSVSSGNAGTVTSVGLSAPTGFSVSGSPVTTSGTLALSFSAGYSLPSDATQATWTAKQNALNGTGFVKISGTTISYDNSTYYLASNPSGFTSNVGTVTSVGMSVPTGLSISGTPITTSGTLALSLTAGYSIPTTSSQVTWDTAFNRSLTSIGVSGTTTKTLTLTKQDGTTLTASWSDINTDAVTSVFGRTGAIVATSGDYTTAQVTESGNLYYLDSRARASISGGTGISYNSTTGVITNTITQYTDALARASLSFVAGSGAYNSTTGVITIPTNTSQLTNGAGYITGITSGMVTTALGYTPVTNARQLTINGTAYDLSADRSWTISGTIGGLTSGFIPKATSASTLGNSIMSESGSVISVAGSITTSGGFKFTGATWTNQASVGGIDYAGGVRFYSLGANSTTKSGFEWHTNSSDGSIDVTAMRLDSAGNLGIGTTSPSTLLQVGSQNTSTELLRLGVSYNVANTQRGAITWHDGSGITGKIWTTYDGSNRTDMYFGGLYNGGYDGSSILTLLGTGNVGIGTTTPGEKLTINGYIGLQNSGTQRWHVGVDGSNSLSFTRSGIAERMVLSSDGNLGLGVTPSAWSAGLKALQIGSQTALVNNSQYTYLSTNWDGNGDKYLVTGYSTIYRQQSGEHAWFTAPSGTAGNAISFTQAMTLDSSGNLMVGTTSSSYITANRTSIISNGTSAALMALMVGGVNKGYFYSEGTNIYLMSESASGFMSFGTANSEKARITSGGNILIGTSTDSGYKLDVNGTGRFTQPVSLTGAAKISCSNTANTSAFEIGLLGGSTDPNAYIYQRANSGLIFGTNNATVFTLASTGAATFSSDVTIAAAGQLYLTSGDLRYSSNAGFGIVSANGNRLVSIQNGAFGVTGAATFSNTITVNGSGNFSWGFPSTAVAKIGAPGTGGSLLVMTPSLNSGYESGLAIDGTYSGGKSEININAFGVYSGGPYSADLVFKTSTNTTLSEKMRITSGGNVLIGTTTDSGYKLDVNAGNLRVKGSTNEQLVLDYTTASGGFTWQSFRINGTNKYRIFGHTDNSFALYSDTASAQVLTFASTGAATFSSSVTATSFIKTGGTSSQYLMADGSVTTSSGGVSGSGTTNYIPKWNGTTSLANSQIFDNGTQVTVGSNVAMYKFAVNPVSNSYFGIGFTGTNSIFVNAVDSGFTSVPIVNNAISHEWLVGFGSAMLLNSSLNLLIGTTTGVSGGGKLQVNGDVNINGNFKINGTVIGGGGGSGITGSGTTNMIAKWTGGTALGDSALYDNGAYSMGIGTTSISFPTDRKGLVVRPNGANSGEILLQNSGNTNGSTDGFAIANINGDGVALYNRINAHIRFGTNNVERLRITEDGNLGFGTTSQFGGGVKVVGLANCTTVPGTTPTGGGILFVQNGALKYMGSNGTYTTIANA